MKSNKFSKKNLDDETADLIDSKYPAELDVDRIFRKSYKEFLKSDVPDDSDTEKQSKTVVSSVPVEIIQSKHRFAFFSLSKVCAVISGIIAITGFYALLKMPVSDIETPDDVNKFPVVTDNNNNTSATFKISATTGKTTATTNSASTTTSTVTETIITTSAESTAVEPVIINTEQIEETTESKTTTEIQAETTEIQTEEKETQTEEMQIEIIVTATTLTTTQSETTTSPPQTTTETINYGNFEYIVDETGNEWNELKYNRNPDIPIENIDYAFELDGYEMSIYRDDEFSKNLNITETSSGNHFALIIVPYEYFGNSFNTKYEWVIEMTEINGKPAVISRRADNNEGICTLHWDNGGSICSITGLFAHLEQIKYIAENLK